MKAVPDLTGPQLADFLWTLRAEAERVSAYDCLAEACRRLKGISPSVGAIRAERAVQDQKWGGPTHDDRHAGAEWRRFIAEHAEKGDLLAVAALGFAVTEVLDRLRERVGQAENVLRGGFGE